GAILKQAGDLAAHARPGEIIVGGALEQEASGQPFRARRADRHLVDDAASAANPLQRVRTVDELDPVDEEAVDGEAVAAAVAQRRRLGDAVDRIKRRTTAQALARAGQ